jgi:hypothetical protein
MTNIVERCKNEKTGAEINKKEPGILKLPG